MKEKLAAVAQYWFWIATALVTLISVGVWWITEAFLVDAAAHGWMAPFALLFMAGGLALFCITGTLKALDAGLHPVSAASSASPTVSPTSL